MIGVILLSQTGARGRVIELLPVLDLEQFTV